jgi:hypothetical protein
MGLCDLKGGGYPLVVRHRHSVCWFQRLGTHADNVYNGPRIGKQCLFNRLLSCLPVQRQYPLQQCESESIY